MAQTVTYNVLKKSLHNRIFSYLQHVIQERIFNPVLKDINSHIETGTLLERGRSIPFYSAGTASEFHTKQTTTFSSSIGSSWGKLNSKEMSFNSREF